MLAEFANPSDPQLEGNAWESTGFSAKRFEFDPENDANAELPIADMEMRADDSEEERALKLRMLRVYNDRLDERRRRRDFILSRGLLNTKKIQALEKVGCTLPSTKGP
jgi:transcriptional adapter 2-alpha